MTENPRLYGVRRTRAEVEALIEKNQEAYAEGWLQTDQYAWNMAALSAELDALERDETDV